MAKCNDMSVQRPQRKKDENHDFNENYKKLLSAMEWVVRASKDLKENDEKHDFDKKKITKK